MYSLCLTLAGRSGNFVRGFKPQSVTKLYVMNLTANYIMAKLTNQFQRTRLVTPWTYNTFYAHLVEKAVTTTSLF